jgi:hypothetical protein
MESNIKTIRELGWDKDPFVSLELCIWIVHCMIAEVTRELFSPDGPALSPGRVAELDRRLILYRSELHDLNCGNSSDLREKILDVYLPHTREYFGSVGKSSAGIPAPEDFELQEHDSEGIFLKLETAMLSAGSPARRPMAVIVGGQPGAGKSNLINHVTSRSPVPYTLVNGDDYRPYHPCFHRIAVACDKRLAELTEPAVRGWTGRLFDRAAAGSFNCVLEITLRQPGPISETVRRLRGMGYAVHLKVLALKGEFSLLGTQRRYEAARLSNGFGRWTSREAHDASYGNLPGTLRLVEAETPLSSVQILNSDGEVLYGNERDAGGRWVSPGKGAYDAVMNIRDRPLTDRGRSSLVSGWGTILDLKRGRRAPQDEIAVAEGILEGLREGA